MESVKYIQEQGNNMSPHNSTIINSQPILVYVCLHLLSSTPIILKQISDSTTFKYPHYFQRQTQQEISGKQKQDVTFNLITLIFSSYTKSRVIGTTLVVSYRDYFQGLQKIKQSQNRFFSPTYYLVTTQWHFLELKHSL